MKIGRRIYFDKSTGNVIVDTGERSGHVVETTNEHDFEVYTALTERNRETVGVLELEYGQYAEDFAACNGFRVNPETLELEFSYPNPDDPETPPAYRKPLSEELEETKERITDLELTIAEMMTM
ncbi:hypothetical protein [Paenibacillus sp. MSJ-34]|uniref:hypothetical protein n=1 Tax=Paenibacillus sp. MSJ-34 TaxID=2841529 RepID=UPI001C11387C|nr:hypothetical protein [Paenibacillus sp. MSJ-34]MBU5441198.1 hypothetical protein [Paenibacillus sp. MSJ-34]